MKTRKSVLSSTIAGALLAGSSAAIAQGPPPNETVPERGMEVCTEQQISVLAAIAERQGCAATTGTYTLSGDVDASGNGNCTLDDYTVAVNTGITQLPLRGSQHLTTSGVGEVDDIQVADLAGIFYFSGAGEIFYGSAIFLLCVPDPLIPAKCTGSTTDPGWENYDEHIIKDFWADPQQPTTRFILDEGLEVITKNNWPRMKYRQSSTYTPPNGGIGNKTIDKLSVAPDNAPVCNIQYNAQVDDFGGGIQWVGAAIVF